MNTGKRIVAAALGGALCLATSTGLSAADVKSSVTMKPLMATSLDAGSQHVVSYFLKADGVCKLTLMISEKLLEDASDAPKTASRLQLSIAPEKSARFDAADGKSLDFACKADALAMSATTLDRVALAPVAE
jgi:hypothetical protein